MSLRSPHFLTLVIIACAAMCGCGAAESATKLVADNGPAQLAVVPAEAKSPEASSTNPADSKTVAEQSVEKEAPQASFEPPYPDRENLFLTPKRSASNTKTTGSIGQSVELLGFANVAGPRVILSINGVVVPLSEGAKQSGIEVISIQPPAVVLQRDRERWQATLEN